jgi:hypothetical protein
LRISILDDYHDTLRTLGCFTRLSGHDVVNPTVLERRPQCPHPPA